MNGRVPGSQDPPVHTGGSPALTVLVRNLEQLGAALAWRPAAVYCDFEDVRRYKDAVPRAKAAGVPIGLATLRIWKPGEDGFQSPVVRADPDLVLVRNLASLSYFREHLPPRFSLGRTLFLEYPDASADAMAKAADSLLARLVLPVHSTAGYALGVS